MATRHALGPAPAEPHNSRAPAAARFSSFHRTLQEGTLAKLISIEPDYWARLSEYHDQFDQLMDARAAVQTQADVVSSCAAVMESLHVRARADQNIIRSALHSKRPLGKVPPGLPAGSPFFLVRPAAVDWGQ